MIQNWVYPLYWPPYGKYNFWEQASLHYWSWRSKSVWSIAGTFLTVGLKDTGTKCAEHLLGTYFAQPKKSHKVHSSAPLPFCRNFFCPSDFCCFPKDYQIFPVPKFCVSSGLPFLAVYWRLHNSSAVPQTFIIFPNPGVTDSPYLWLITVDQKFSPEYHLGSPLLILLLTRRSIFSDGQPTTLCTWIFLFVASAHAVHGLNIFLLTNVIKTAKRLPSSRLSNPAST